MDKKTWRAKATKEREHLTFDSVVYCETLNRFLTEAVAPTRRVVIYDAMAGEVSLGPLVEAHEDPANRFAITRTPDEGHTLTVHPHGCDYERHRYGYRQPVADAPVIPDDTIGAVLVPALAFDRSGVRLGRGMGYYDRFLARLEADVLFVGITGGYIVDALPAEPFDIAMTHLALEDEVVVISSR